MKGEHTPTIIRLTLSTDLALIQLKDSHKILRFLNIDHSTNIEALMYPDSTLLREN